jgi:TatD DNase family protein
LGNVPANVKIVAQRLAEIKVVSFEEIAEATTQNARQLFKR